MRMRACVLRHENIQTGLGLAAIARYPSSFIVEPVRPFVKPLGAQEQHRQDEFRLGEAKSFARLSDVNHHAGAAWNLNTATLSVSHLSDALPARP